MSTIPYVIEQTSRRSITMRTMKYSNKSMVIFFTTVIMLSITAETVICAGGADWMYAILMWIPAFSGIVTVAIQNFNQKGSLKSLLQDCGFHKCKPGYLLLGFGIPLIYLICSYYVYWILHQEYFAYSGVPLLIRLKDCCIYSLVSVVVSLLTALGEEIGWRGFMVPALYERWGLNRTLVFTSAFWCCWHLPLLIFGDYMEGAPLWYQLPAFILCIFPVGIIVGLLVIKAESIWPAAMLHASHNAFDQAVFGIMTSGENKMYFVSETGIFTIVFVWVIAVILYLKMQPENEIIK